MTSSGCKDLVHVPSPKTLQLTASVSSALLIMQVRAGVTGSLSLCYRRCSRLLVCTQLYASRGSRRAFVSLVQLVVVSALGSVACGAILLRLFQLMDRNLSARSVPLLHHVRRFLLRNQSGSQAQLSDSSASSSTENKAALLRKAATSASAVAAVIYVMKRLRR